MKILLTKTVVWPRWQHMLVSLAGPYVTRIKRRISRRLGVPIERISNKFVWTIYSDGCYTQQWVEGTSGPWCSIFSPRDLKCLCSNACISV